MFCARHFDSWLPLSELTGTPFDLDGAARRRVEAANQVEQRRLAGARRSHQREEVALRDLQVDAFEHVDALAAAREVFVDVFDANEFIHIVSMADLKVGTTAGTALTAVVVLAFRPALLSRHYERTGRKFRAEATRPRDRLR